MPRFTVVLSTISFGKKIELPRTVWGLNAQAVQAEHEGITGYKFERVEPFAEPNAPVFA